MNGWTTITRSDKKNQWVAQHISKSDLYTYTRLYCCMSLLFHFWGIPMQAWQQAGRCHGVDALHSELRKTGVVKTQ
jgi:hypothetical protein